MHHTYSQKRTYDANAHGASQTSYLSVNPPENLEVLSIMLPSHTKQPIKNDPCMILISMISQSFFSPPLP